MAFDRIYGAQRIVRPALADSPLINTYRQVRRLSEESLQNYGRSSPLLFSQQAELLKSLVDDYHEPPCDLIDARFPIYADLRTTTLRHFITWRTQARQGRYGNPQPGFVLLALEELTLPGYCEPMESLKRMLQLLPLVPNSLDAVKLVRDFVIWHDLDPKILAQPRLAFGDENLAILVAPAEHTPEELDRALRENAFLRRGEPLCVRKDPSRWQNFMQLGWITLNCLAAEGAAPGFFFWGYWQKIPRSFFSSTYYPRPDAHPDASYRVNAAHTFTCKKGLWNENRVQIYRSDKTAVGAFFAELARRTQPLFGLPTSRKRPAALPPLFERALQATLEAIHEQERQARLDQVKIDVGNLSGIRADAQDIEEKLVVDEPQEFSPAPAPKAPAVAVSAAAPESAAVSSSPLTKEEEAFCRALLTGTDYEEARRATNLLLSVLVDRINEKLFDAVGDAVLEVQDGTPSVVTDYREELEHLLS